MKGYVNQTGRSITRHRVVEWTTIYRSRGGHEIKIISFARPKRTRVFRVPSTSGRRKFTATSVKKQAKEVILVAKRKKNDDVLTDEDLEELEALEELDDEDVEEEDEDVEDLEDEEEDDEDYDEDEEDEDEDPDEEEEEMGELEDEDEEEDEEEEEEPPKRKKRAKKSKKSKPSRSRTTDGRVGTAEVAAAAGVDGRSLRMVLRKHNIAKDPETKRYEWSSLKHPEVKKILRLVKDGAVGKAKKAQISKAKKSATKKTHKKGASKKRAHSRK